MRRTQEHSRLVRGTLLAALLAGSLGPAFAQITNPFPDPIPKSPLRIELQAVATGLGSPNALFAVPGAPGVLFFPEQTGTLRYLDTGTGTLGTSLDLSSRLVPLNANYDERGLLGAAFHPGFADPLSAGYRKLYTYSSELASGTPDYGLPATGTVNHHSLLTEWSMTPGGLSVDPASRREVLRFAQPQANHNGGQLAFGSDGYLYISTGDGGSANDVAPGHVTGTGNGQTTGTVLGKILRIDPVAPAATPGSADAASANGAYRLPAGNPFVGGGGAPEVYAYGFRNPFRFSFDDGVGGSGALIVGDVGQRQVEEVSIVELGQNHGWNVKEGTFLFDPSDPVALIADSPGLPAGMTDPVLQYDHSEGIAVIAGFVYRGSALPGLTGKYVFGDLSRAFTFSAGSGQGRLFVGDLASGSVEELTIGSDDRALGLFLKGFGEDANGELYVLAANSIGPGAGDGVILRIAPVPEPQTWATMAVGLTVLGFATRRRLRRRA